ncbi:MAG: hypothetical protein E7223_07870, partial [Clostridiales bacterium]|nr:hypothetical protein [Clostridiales bacterium]
AYAQVLIILTPFYAALLIRAEKLRHKVFWGAMLLAALYALFMTYSRTGYISLAVGIFVFAMIVNWRVLPLCIVLGLMALPMLPDTIYRRIMSIFNLADSSTSYRLNIMKTVLQPALERWKCGIGLGSDAVRQIVSNYTLYNEGAVPVHSHNVYLQIFAETGIFGILSFLASMIHLAKEAFRMGYHKLCESSLKYFIIAGAAGMAGCLVFGLAEYIWFYPRLMVLFWMVYAMIAAAVRIAKEEVAKEEANA